MYILCTSAFNILGNTSWVVILDICYILSGLQTILKEESNMNKWWGYIHNNGSLQVKRFFSQEDLTEARESDFVARVYGPWECKDRESALARLKEDSGR